MNRRDEWVLGRLEDEMERRAWAEHETEMAEAAPKRPDYFGPRIESGFGDVDDA